MGITVRTLRPLDPTPRTVQRAARSLVSLTRLAPGSRNAERRRPDVERLLMRILAGGGTRGLDRVARAARPLGIDLALTQSQPGYRAWRCVLGEQGILEVRGHTSRGFRYTLVTWRPPPAPLALTPAQRRADREQQAFYTRYMAVGKRAYALPPKPISAVDRAVLLVGELEADVNNGGFAQYLDNKGRRRAQAALRALRRIGARTTAALLATALKPATPPGVLGRLDNRFYAMREDVARLATRKYKLASVRARG